METRTPQMAKPLAIIARKLFLPAQSVIFKTLSFSFNSGLTGFYNLIISISVDNFPRRDNSVRFDNVFTAG